jgi:tetratricopeptide (TPR) repeat protein
MKLDSLSAIAASAFVWLVGCPTLAVDKEPKGTDFAIFSICRVEQHATAPGGGERITIESGMGTGGFAIATRNPQAQRWFDYGIKLFHAFYHDDARRAFDKAVGADPHCAMCLWGQALSRGPNQNFDTSDDDVKQGLEMAKKALAAARTARERLLANALIRRYSRTADVAAERDFSTELLKASTMGPATPDLRLLAAEVLLTAYRREDHSTAPQAVALIEPILRQTPDNTAAIHYYIHATEFAATPALALAYAEKLSALAPRASHLVHMAAHTFLRVGRYEDAATINAFALRVDAEHLTDTGTPGLPSAAPYYGHNLSFGMAGTVMSGDRALGLKFADHVHRAYAASDFVKDEMSYLDYRRFVIYARFDPERMLALTEPVTEGPQTLSFWHYARGEAFAARHDADGVAREAALVTGDAPIMSVARGVLVGRLAMLQGHYAAAAEAFEGAAAKQETLLVSAFDPPAWWYPVRRSAAAAWLLDGQYAKAADAATTSLKAWPADPLALLVLSRAQDGQGHGPEARHAHRQLVGRYRQGRCGGDLSGRVSARSLNSSCHGRAGPAIHLASGTMDGRLKAGHDIAERWR